MINGQREVFPFEEKYTVENVAEKLGVSVKKVEKKLNKFKSSYLRHTRQYILSLISEQGLSYSVHRGIMCKEDFIEEYYRSRDENDEYVFDIDFSLVPEVIPDRRYHVTIIINELSQWGKRIGELRVYYDRFIRERRNGRQLNEIVRFRTNQKRKTEEFIRKSKEMFPGCFSYEKTVYIAAHKKLTLRCLKCGKEFQQTPTWHFKSLGMCPDCAQEEAKKHNKNNMTSEKFFEIVNEKFGEILDFSDTVFDGIEDKEGNAKYVTIKIKKTGEKIKRQVKTLLYTDMKVGRISRGEMAVSSALLNMKIEFSPQKYYKITENCMPELSDIRKGVAVDFFLTLDGKDYIIEYNGQQHYMFVENWVGEESLDIYKERVRRDNSVRKFCKENNITLIEIPYTIGVNRRVIEKKLRQILLNKESVEKIFPTIIPKSYE